MSTENTSATSPASSGDAPKTGSENLSTGAAAMMMLASATKPSSPQPARQAAEETSTETPATPTAEAETAPELTATTEETPAPETTEDAPETPTTEADPVHSQTISFTPEQQEIFNRRLGKEVAKTKAIQSQMAEATAKLSELEARLGQQAPAPPPVVITPQPLSEINDPAALGDLRKTAKEALRYVEEVLEDPSQWTTKTVVDPVTGDERDITIHTIGETTYTKAELLSQRRKTRVTLEDHIPQREQFLASRVESSRQAHIQFPFLTDRQSAEYQMAEAARRNPALAPIMSMPQAEYILGVQIRGLRALAEDAAKAAKPKPKVAAPKPSNDQAVVSSGSSSSVRQPSGSGERSKLSAEMTKLGSKGGITSEDAQSLLLRHEQLRKNR